MSCLPWSRFPRQHEDIRGEWLASIDAYSQYVLSEVDSPIRSGVSLVLADCHVVPTCSRDSDDLNDSDRFGFDEADVAILLHGRHAKKSDSHPWHPPGRVETHHAAGIQWYH